MLKLKLLAVFVLVLSIVAYFEVRPAQREEVIAAWNEGVAWVEAIRKDLAGD